MKIIANQATTLTKESIDSSQETLPGWTFEVNKGSEFNVRAIAQQINAQGKRLVTFDQGLGSANFNTWFLFPSHWNLEGTARTDYPEAKVSQAATESSERKEVNWWDGKSSKISQYFTESDVTNDDNRRIPEKGSGTEANTLKMANELDKIRAEWGAPIGVTSWNRPPVVNREVGGAQYSQHLNGGAADIYTLDGRDYQFEDFLDRHWGGGLGYGIASGRGFTHLDLREGGWRRGLGTIRWSY